jgi:hypothetical protein
MFYGCKAVAKAQRGKPEMGWRNAEGKMAKAAAGSCVKPTSNHAAMQKPTEIRQDIDIEILR